MRSVRWRFDTILFDFDGTLADTQEDVWDALDNAAAEIGSKLPGEMRGNPANLAFSMKELFEMLEPPPAPEQLDAFKRETRRYYRIISDLPKTQLYPGIEKLLQRLNKAEIPCYIVSLKEHGALLRTLDLKGWHHYFSGHFSPDSFFKKSMTKSQLLAWLLSELHTKAPVYIGDSYTDVLAARENGIPCIGVTYGDGNTKKLLAAQPEYVVNEAVELEGILRS